MVGFWEMMLEDATAKGIELHTENIGSAQCFGWLLKATYACKEGAMPQWFHVCWFSGFHTGHLAPFRSCLQRMPASLCLLVRAQLAAQRDDRLGQLLEDCQGWTDLDRSIVKFLHQVIQLVDAVCHLLEQLPILAVHGEHHCIYLPQHTHIIQVNAQGIKEVAALLFEN